MEYLTLLIGMLSCLSLLLAIAYSDSPEANCGVKYISVAQKAPTLLLMKQRAKNAAIECKKLGEVETAENLEAIANLDDFQEMKNKLDEQW